MCPKVLREKNLRKKVEQCVIHRLFCLYFAMEGVTPSFASTYLVEQCVIHKAAINI